MEFIGSLSHGSGIQIFGLTGFNNDQNHQWQTQVEQFGNKIAARFVPEQENANTATEHSDVVKHEVLQGLERQLVAHTNRSQDLEHLIGMRQTTARREAIRPGADEQQVQKRFLRRDSTSKGSGHRYGFLESVTMGMLDERIQHQRVPHKELILEFLHHRFAYPRPTAPEI